MLLILEEEGSYVAQEGSCAAVPRSIALRACSRRRGVISDDVVNMARGEEQPLLLLAVEVAAAVPRMNGSECMRPPTSLLLLQLLLDTLLLLPPVCCETLPSGPPSCLSPVLMIAGMSRLPLLLLPNN